MSRSSSDSATTGFGNSGYQSAGDRFDVAISDRPFWQPVVFHHLATIVGLGETCMD